MNEISSISTCFQYNKLHLLSKTKENKINNSRHCHSLKLKLCFD